MLSCQEVLFVLRIQIHRFTWVFSALTLLGLAAGLSSPAVAQVQDWPLLYDTTVVHHLNLSTMAATDITCSGAEDPTTWAEIQQDTTTLVEHPALFWADGEEASKLCVTLRHKGGNARIGDPLDPKIALKIDINQLVPGQRWHDVRKLSLEEGGDTDTASEGIAWILERLAADHVTTAADFTPGLTGWASVAVNGTEYGLYTNLEQKDKSFFQHRGVFDAGATWLYKVEELRFSPLGLDHPNQATLCYPPFDNSCATPDDATLETELEALIDMDVMLTQGAVEMFIVAPDNFFSKNVNYWHADWEAPVNLKRRYLTDDLDTVFRNSTWDIYGVDQQGGPSDIQTIIVGHPSFGPRFDEAMCKLLAGPFQAAALTQMVTDVETAITADLLADPNNNIKDGTLTAGVADHFDKIRLYSI